MKTSNWKTMFQIGWLFGAVMLGGLTGVGKPNVHNTSGLTGVGKPNVHNTRGALGWGEVYSISLPGSEILCWRQSSSAVTLVLESQTYRCHVDKEGVG
jgi:hypothetical protein